MEGADSLTLKSLCYVFKEKVWMHWCGATAMLLGEGRKQMAYGREELCSGVLEVFLGEGKYF